MYCACIPVKANVYEAYRSLFSVTKSSVWLVSCDHVPFLRSHAIVMVTCCRSLTATSALSACFKRPIRSAAAASCRLVTSSAATTSSTWRSSPTCTTPTRRSTSPTWTSKSWCPKPGRRKVRALFFPPPPPYHSHSGSTESLVDMTDVQV